MGDSDDTDLISVAITVAMMAGAFVAGFDVAHMVYADEHEARQQEHRYRCTQMAAEGHLGRAGQHLCICGRVDCEEER